MALNRTHFGSGLKRLAGSAAGMPNPIAGGTNYQQQVGSPASNIRPMQGISPGQSAPQDAEDAHYAQRWERQQQAQSPGVIQNPFGPPGVETGGAGPIALGGLTGGGGPLTQHSIGQPAMQPSVPDVQNALGPGTTAPSLQQWQEQNAPRRYSPMQEAQGQIGNQFLTQAGLRPDITAPGGGLRPQPPNPNAPRPFMPGIRPDMGGVRNPFQQRPQRMNRQQMRNRLMQRFRGRFGRRQQQPWDPKTGIQQLRRNWRRSTGVR